MPPKKAKKTATKKPKVQRGGMMMITPQYRQMGNPYAGVQTGEGFFGDLWDEVKSVGKKAFNFVKDNKLVSTGLAMSGDPRLKAASGVASQFGLGKKRAHKNVLKF